MRTTTLISTTLSMLFALPALGSSSGATKVRLNRDVGKHTTQRGVFSYAGYGGMRGKITLRDADARMPQRLVIQVEKAPSGVPSASPGFLPLKISGEGDRQLNVHFRRQHVGKKGRYLRYEVQIPARNGKVGSGDIKAIARNLLGPNTFRVKTTREVVIPASGRGEFFDGQGRSINARWKFDPRKIEVMVKAENRGEYQAAKARAAGEATTGKTGYLIAVSSTPGGAVDLVLRRFIAVNAQGEIVHRVVADGQKLTPHAVRQAIERLATN